MKVEDIAAIIEAAAPLDTAESYDNVGLLVGEPDTEVTGVMVSVDVTREVVEEAVANGCNLIVSHHPIIFSPIKGLLLNTLKGSLIAECIVKGIALYAAHTNVDNMQNNMSRWLAKAVGGVNIQSLTESGLGAVFEFKNHISFLELKQRVAVTLEDDNIKSVGNPNQMIKKCATVSGAGGRDETLVNLAKAKCADVFISGEFRFDIAVSAAGSSFKLIDVGHYNSEKPFLEIMTKLISSSQNEVKTLKSNKEFNPYN